MLNTVVLIALLSAFCILLFGKTGLIEFFQTFGSPIMAKLFSCPFCLSFWLNFIISTGYFAVFDRSPEVLLYPFLATPITRVLL